MRFIRWDICQIRCLLFSLPARYFRSIARFIESAWDRIFPNFSKKVIRIREKKETAGTYEGGLICLQKRNQCRPRDFIHQGCHLIIHYLHDADVTVHHGARVYAVRFQDNGRESVHDNRLLQHSTHNHDCFLPTRYVHVY